MKNLNAPAIAVAVTLVLWMASVSLIDRPRDETRTMLIWASSLLVSLFISIAFVARLSRLAVKPAAFAIVYASLRVHFALLRG